MILAVDPGIGTLGWAIVHPRTCVVHALGVLIQEHDPDLDDTTCRARRGHCQALELGRLIVRWSCTTIAGEAVSLGGPPAARMAMAKSLNFSWGVFTALAAIHGLELVEVRPKEWQHAIQPEAAGAKIDYQVVFVRIAEFLTGEAVEQLEAIPSRHRNHAADGVGVGEYAALHPEATRISNGAGVRSKAG